MIERFEALAARFLDLAEGTKETQNSAPEKKAQYAIAAAECAKAAATLRAEAFESVLIGDPVFETVPLEVEEVTDESQS